MFFDNLAIPKDAAHVAEAHAFIDYLLRPEVAATNSNLVAYANGNLASQKFIDRVDTRRQKRLSGRFDHEPSLHGECSRSEIAAADQSAMD